MKKHLFFLILGFSSFLMVNAQKENGTVYSDHESIGKTKAMWAAFVKGDKDTYLSFYADTIRYAENGVMKKVIKSNMGSGVDFWKGIDQLAIKDDAPAFPDAIEYKEGGLWVQDWLKISGIHKNSGIHVDWPVHNLYHFNKAGKIDMLSQYYDPSLFEELNNSQRTIENGTVYIDHPYIVTVRKLINAYCSEDIAAIRGFYSPKAVFQRSENKADQMINLEEKLKVDTQTFDYFDDIKLTQTGYPDCIYYSKNDSYTVYSWWILSCTTKEGKKLTDIPVLLTDDFNKEGKITREFVYLSSSHFK